MSLSEAIGRTPDHWLKIAVGSVLAAFIGWASLQLVAMRDDIHTLKDGLPAVAQRVERLEERQDDVIRVLVLDAEKRAALRP